MFVIGQTSPALTMTIKAIDLVKPNQNLDRPGAWSSRTIHCILNEFLNSPFWGSRS